MRHRAAVSRLLLTSIIMPPRGAPRQGLATAVALALGTLVALLPN
jgi:hypothetical protein